MIQRRGSSAREREPEHRYDEEIERRHALRADEHASGARDEQQAHDARLRQRDVVAPGGERRRFTAERAGDGHERGSERDGGRPDVQRDRPRRVVAPCDDTTERDRREEHDERADAPNEERRIRDPREDDVRDEERQRDERHAPVRRGELEHGAHDDEADGHGAGDGRQPEQHARRDVRARQGCARHAAHAASSSGRSAAARSSRTARRRSCAAAAARSCTTRACPPATGRCRRASRSRASSAR